MPTYEYQCESCGELSEYFQSITAGPMTECEKCGGKLTRLLSGGTGLIFKGSGFYITDYKTGGGSSVEGAGSGGGGGSDKGSAGSGGGEKSSAPTAPAAGAGSGGPGGSSGSGSGKAD